MELILIIFIAFFVAVIFSMLGLGGAIIYTPLFFWMGLPLLIAIPMALLLNTITTASASMTYLKQRLVDTKIAYPIIFSAIPGALLIGPYLARIVDTQLIILLLSTILLFASAKILFFNSIGFTLRTDGMKKTIFCAGMGFLIGILSSMVGVGGGTFIVPLLLVIGFEIKKATATSSFIITFIALAGFLGHLFVGQQQMDTSILFFTGAAVFTGAQAGSRMVFKRLSPGAINRLFAFVLLIIAGELLYGVI